MEPYFTAPEGGQYMQSPLHSLDFAALAETLALFEKLAFN
jgi:hypothetical protein